MSCIFDEFGHIDVLPNNFDILKSLQNLKEFYFNLYRVLHIIGSATVTEVQIKFQASMDITGDGVIVRFFFLK